MVGAFATQCRNFIIGLGTVAKDYVIVVVDVDLSMLVFLQKSVQS
jgi:hypothetical protein